MAAIGYARVSTIDQHLSLQLDALQQANCSCIFRETASGTIRDRPELRKAIAALKPGDTLVVWKLDRLARSLSQLIDTIDELHQIGCGFKSITESIDTTTAGGRLIFHIFGALAEFERSIIRERTIAGLHAARARGRKGGRPKALGDERLTAVAALLADGKLTVQQIAQSVGVSPATIYKHIPRPRSSTEVGNG
jgi:DNA invertase Pin-like site-specific DNA recombinase